MSEDNPRRGGRLSASAGRGVPTGLAVAGSWAWRLVFLAVAGYIALLIVRKLALLFIAIFAAMLLTALLRPVATTLQRRLPGPLASLLTLLLALAVLAAAGYFVVVRAIADMPRLVDQFITTVEDIQKTLQNLLAGSQQVDQISQTVTDWLRRQQSNAFDIITTSATYLLQVGTVLLLTLFISFFLLYQGERIWQWMLSAFSGPMRERCDKAGQVAWESVTGYIRGTGAIATIHGVVIFVVLLVLGTPLAGPLALLVFFGSFIPLIGAVVAGGLAVLVTFSTGGWLPALILTGILILQNQLEGNVLQPLIMGHSVNLHPMAVGLVVTAGTLVWGIIGALIAVPLAATAYRAAPVLVGRDPPE